MMEKQNFVYTDPNGQQINIKVKVNKGLKNKSKKDSSKLKRKVAAFGLALTIGVGTVLGGCALFNNQNKTSVNDKQNNPSTSTQPTDATEPNKKDDESEVNTDEQITGIKEGLRFDPNSKEYIINNAVFLIEEAAKCGKDLDAKDAVLTVITANADRLTFGFMGELFGERANQTYTYGHLVDAYLRTLMIQVETIGIAKDDSIAFNIENIFANNEDYAYLCQIRELTTRFNNSTDETEKIEIVNELNKIALNLCTYETYDISSSAGILSMLSLDGMRVITNNSNNPILHDDIRDEMFGNGDYACLQEGTYTDASGQVLQAQYSFRVNDLKLDSVKSKLDNAILESGKTTVLEEIINEVEEKTKDVAVSNFNTIDEINKQRDENRDVPYEYEDTPGDVKDDYSEKKDDDVVENVNGQDVIVVPDDTIIDPPTTEPPTTEPPATEPPKGGDNTENKNEDKIEDNKEDADKKLEDQAIDAQAEANRGAADGQNDAMSGLSKRDVSGMNEHYANAYNISYDAWKKVYDAQHSNEQDVQVGNESSTVTQTKSTNYSDYVNGETISLDGLTLEELQLVRELLGSSNAVTKEGPVKTL